MRPVVGVRLLPATANVDERCLSPDEQAAAAAMRAPGAAVAHRRGRALLRHAVATTTGLPAAAVPVRSTATGRPVVDIAGGPGVGVGHCGRTTVVALRPDGPVGVDVEVAGARRRPVPAAVLTPERLDTVDDLVDEALRPLAVWVLLEAALKAAGTGFAQPQSGVRFTRTGTGGGAGVRLDLPASGPYGAAVRVLGRSVLVAVATPVLVPVVRWHDVGGGGGTVPTGDAATV